MTCGPTPLPSCTTDDVLVGLSQLSVQLHTLSAFLMFTAVVLVVVLVVLVVVTFANGAAAR